MKTHGFDRIIYSIQSLLNDPNADDFINENLILKNDTILIIHGIGSGIVKNSVHDTLKQNKYVLEYKTDNFNHGCTIVKLNLKEVKNG